MKDKVVVVTGAAGVLGDAVAREAAARGARVAMIDLAEIPNDRGAVGNRHLRLSGVDLGAFDAVKAAMDKVRTTAGRLDTLFNIAGGFRWRTLGDGDIDDWDALYAMNVRTAANASKAALPHLIERNDGRIVNVGALSAVAPGVGFGPYAASKAGVAKLTESLAEELKGCVRVNAVLPSIIDTPTNRRDMPSADHSSWVQSDELARIMLFLASDDARAITGALVPVRGGC